MPNKMAELVLFHWADYLLFAASLAVTIIVGIVYAVKYKWRTQTSETYLLGNRRINAALNGFSTIATNFTSTMVVGVPTEFYYFGVEFIWSILGVSLASMLTAFVIIPKFRNLGTTITSGYEYIELRFHVSLRIFATIIYSLVFMLFLSTIVYGPAIAFSHVTHIHILWGIAVPSAVNLIYTVLGGMRAIVVVDTIQLLILILGAVILAILGSVQAGGLTVLYEHYKAGDRNNWNDIRPVPWQRHTVWSLVFLFILQRFTIQGAHQMYMQRYLNVASLRKAQVGMFITPFFLVLFVCLMWITGMLAYYLFGHCEPSLTGQIERRDQLVAMTIMAIYGQYHGIPGLIIAAVFAGGLSTLSSGINSLCAILLEDLVKPCYRMANKKNISDAQAGKIVRYSSLMFGVLIWAISMWLPYMGFNLTTLTYSIMACVATPMFGIFAVGWFIPWAETVGVFIGYLGSAGIVLSMFVGSIYHATRIGFEPRPLSLDGCPVLNTTDVGTTTSSIANASSFVTSAIVPNPKIPTYFDTSYLWYSLSGLTVMFVVSMVVSAIVHCVRHQGRPPWKDICRTVDRNLLFTKDDVYFALGRRDKINISEMMTANKSKQNEARGKFPDSETGLYHRRADAVPVYNGTTATGPGKTEEHAM